MNTASIAANILIVLGLSGLILGMLEVVKNRRTIQKWGSVGGIVTGTKVLTHTYRSGSGSPAVSNYEPLVFYEYQVGEKTYRSSRLTFGSSMFSQANAQKITAKYTRGTNVTVYYDPADPGNAVIRTQSNRGIAFIVIGFILLALGYVLMY